MENTNTRICHNCERLLLGSGIDELLLGEIRLAHGAKVGALIMTAAVIEEPIELDAMNGTHVQIYANDLAKSG